MTKFLKVAISTVAAMGILLTATPVMAATPYLTVNREGNGDLVRLTVSNADANSQVYLYRRQGSVSWTSLNIGYTDGFGSFNSLMSLGSDNSNNPVEQYVVVNGQQSYSISTYPYTNGGCTYNCASPTGISLSQSSVSINVGQSTTVQAYNNYGGSTYINAISNSNVVSASVNGSTVTLQGINNGFSTVSVCANNNSQCASIAVTVNGIPSSPLSLSPSSLSMQVGQSTTVYVQNITSGSLYVSNNSNTSVVSTSISGTSVVVSANNPGVTQLTICGNNYGQCTTLPVTVTGYNYGNISFSQNSITLSSNQSASISIYSSNYYNANNYTLSSNSNSAVVSASISGNTVYLYALGMWGTSTLSVCQNGGASACGTITVTVNGYNGGTNCSTYGSYSCGALTLSSSNIPAFVMGQYYSYQFQTTGGSYPYTYSISSGNLPAGLTLSSSGLLYGNPQNSYATSFVLRVSDSYGRTTNASVYIGGSGSVLGSSTYSNGQLINENGTVYIVYKNTKTPFASASVFQSFGFSFDRVFSSGYTNLGISGYVISKTNAAHPWGSWVKNGQTVYFVHELGLIPVPDYATFLNNGGQDILVVQANSWDFQRTLLSSMTYSDARLR